MNHESAHRMEVVPAGLHKATRFLKTWETLILHPADFFKATVEEKKRTFWPALGFLTTAWLVSGVLAGVAYFLFLWSMDPGQPMDLVKLFRPESPSPLIIGVAIEALLFYAVLHNWLGHAMAIRTTNPFRRIFAELLYANSPIVLVSSLLIFLDGLVANGFLALAVSLLSNFEDTINDAPDWVAIMVGICVGLTWVALLCGPLIMVFLYYYSILLTNLFHVARRRAAALSFLVCFFAGLPGTAYSLLTGSILTTFSLSSSEIQTIHNVKSIGSLTTDWTRTYHSEPSIEEIKNFVKGQPQNSIYLLVHAQDISVFQKLDSSNDLDGYHYSIQPGRKSAYIGAVPVRCEGATRRSFVADAGGGRLNSSNSCAPATFTDTPVWMLPGE